jgi:DnaJ-class molecular chaperone
MAEDHYQTLGVSKSASAEDIRKAYRELARKYHPDLHPDDASAKEKFKQVQTAFDVLNDPSKREMYDRYGSSFEGVGAGGPGGGWAGGGGGVRERGWIVAGATRDRGASTTEQKNKTLQAKGASRASARHSPGATSTRQPAQSSVSE